MAVILDYVLGKLRLSADGAQGAQGAQGEQGAQGSQGTAGGAMAWRGAWLTATSYSVDDAVENNGSSYICTQAHTSDASSEPGIGGSWATYWDLIAVKGEQGNQGTQGSQGTQGVQGHQGNQGYQGVQGATGAQGTQGVQGATGATGAQGNQGVQGAQGNQGVQGSQGTQGVQGAQGNQGTQGNQGVKGEPGIFGLPYLFEATAGSSPAAGYIRLNNTTLSSVTHVYVRKTDRLAANNDAYLDLTNIGDIIQIKAEVDTDYVVYTITAITENANDYDFTVTYITNNGGFADEEQIQFGVSFKGATGSQGAQGTQGTQGNQGTQGAQGAQGASGGGGGITWNEVTGTTQTAAVDNGYITNNASQVVVTLPTTAAVGKTVRIAGKGAGGWRVAQNASEIIHFGNVNSTTGTGGYIESTHRYDAVELLCIVADTEWVVLSSVGNITIV